MFNCQRCKNRKRKRLAPQWEYTIEWAPVWIYEWRRHCGSVCWSHRSGWQMVSLPLFVFKFKVLWNSIRMRRMVRIHHHQHRESGYVSHYVWYRESFTISIRLPLFFSWTTRLWLWDSGFVVLLWYSASVFILSRLSESESDVWGKQDTELFDAKQTCCSGAVWQPRFGPNEGLLDGIYSAHSLIRK